MSLDFLSVDVDQLVGRTPITHLAAAQGARMGQSGGFEVAWAFEGVDVESAAALETVVICDTSHSRKLEIQGPGAALDSTLEGLVDGGHLPRHQLEDGGWWCRWHPERAMLVADPLRHGDRPEVLDSALDVLDVTGTWASVTVVGPVARELIARCCSLDLRPSTSQAGDFHPASIARTPGAVLDEGDDRYQLFVGWAVGEYVWTALSDAAAALRGRPAGLECLVSITSRGVGGA